MGTRLDAALRSVGAGYRDAKAHEAGERGPVRRDLQGERAVGGHGAQVLPRGIRQDIPAGTGNKLASERGDEHQTARGNRAPRRSKWTLRRGWMGWQSS